MQTTQIAPDVSLQLDAAAITLLDPNGMMGSKPPAPSEMTDDELMAAAARAIARRMQSDDVCL